MGQECGQGETGRQRGAKYLGQAGRGGMAGGEKSGLETGLSSGGGSWVARGWASYFDRVFSAICFCWLSACLENRY